MSNNTTPVLAALPDDLPRPVDDGACSHLTAGTALPALALEATDGSLVDLSATLGRAVLFVYPRTGRPGVPLPEGWDDIPGARGCTPQSCRFRDLHAEFINLGVQVFGLSTQDSAYQREAVDRLGLTYPLLSDESLSFTRGLSLPTFEATGMTLNKRVTLVLRDGAIEHVVYPVFPPDAATDRLIEYLSRQ